MAEFAQQRVLAETATDLPSADACLPILAAWLASTAEAVAIVSTADTRFSVLAASEAWCRMAGSSAAAVLGAPCGPLLELKSGPDFGTDLRKLVDATTSTHRLLDRDAQGQAFWSTLSVQSVSSGGFLLVTRTAGVDSDEAEDDAAGELGHYEQAARCGGEGLWDWNLVTGSVWYSPGLKALLGYGPDDDFSGSFEGLTAHVVPAHRTLVLNAVRRHLEQRQAFDFECQFQTRGGQQRWFALRGEATRDPAGHPLRLSGSVHDVTERRSAEDLTRHAEDLQRRALDALHVAVGVLNGRGEIVEMNRSWREFESSHGLIGERFCFGEDYALLCEKAVESCAQGPAAARGIREVLDGTRANFAVAYRLGEGESERHYELRAQPFVDGDARGAFLIHMDVSSTREAYARLAASRDFYELLLDSIPIQIAYVNADRRLQYLNRSYEQWFQLPLTALRGRRIDELTGAQDIGPHIDTVLTGQDVDFEIHARRADGEERDLAVNYVAHRDASGAVAGFLSIVRDVTDRRRLEATLRQSQKMEAVGQLTGGIAHDFNNLLNVIIGNLQLLERPLQGQDKLIKQTQTALRAALRGADLTRRLLAFSRQTVLEPRVISVNTLVQSMNELLRRALGREIDIHTELAEEAWSVRVDPSQLENCLLNLAINARDAMPGGGALSIETNNATVDADLARRHPQLRAGDYLVVTVTDTGVGMSADVAKRAFEPFFTTKEVGKGTGLGLSMVYGFLHQSGGLATLYSEVGHGTTLRLYFPRNDGPVTAPKELENRGEALPRGTETVLVVEDDVDVRATAVVALRSLGYEVIEAGDASTALQILRSRQGIDLLFTDVTLPGGMHGPTLVNHAREHLPQLKVLFTSGFSESTILHRGMLDGTLPMIAKPYAIADLARRVRTALAG